MIKQKITSILVHCISPLLVGLCIYSFLRTNETWIAQKLFNKQLLTSDSVLLYHFRFHFPDFLWAYSFSAFILLTNDIKRKFVAALSAVFVSLTEIVTAKYFNQTFDWVDILYMLSVIFLSTIIVKRNNEKLL